MYSVTIRSKNEHMFAYSVGSPGCGEVKMVMPSCPHSRSSAPKSIKLPKRKTGLGLKVALKCPLPGHRGVFADMHSDPEGEGGFGNGNGNGDDDDNDNDNSDDGVDQTHQLLYSVQSVPLTLFIPHLLSVAGPSGCARLSAVLTSTGSASRPWREHYLNKNSSNKGGPFGALMVSALPPPPS